MRRAMAAAVTAGLAFSTAARAQTETILWSLPPASFPYAGLAFDAKTTSLFGTAVIGAGGNGYGFAFSLVDTNGTWQPTLLHTFVGGNDGEYPYGGLVQVSKDTLYGTTTSGGSANDGTVFKLTQHGSSWKHTVIHSFDGHDGYQPYADLIFDKKTGEIYGTTSGGSKGNGGCGNVFEVSSTGTFSVIYSFQGGNDGCGPYAPVRLDAKGRLFGVTYNGGTNGYGTAFMLQKSKGDWTESVLYAFGSFDGDGLYPNDLALDPKTDAIYAVTELGGQDFDDGAVVGLTETNNVWQESVLYSFGAEGGPDGIAPQGIALDIATRVLYGTTQNGGESDAGTVFALNNMGTAWTETQLYAFNSGGACCDGSEPRSRPTLNPTTGALFGTTSEGGCSGDNSCGTVYQIVP